MPVKISFNAIVPKDEFQFKIVDREIRDTMRSVNKPEIRDLFKGTVEGWEEKPVFRGTVSSSRGKYIRLLVQPIGKNKDIYSLVSLGSPPHPISARNAENLVFQRGYRASTKPGSLSSQRKSRFGPVVKVPYLPNGHPGFEGREFDVQIAEKYEPRFQETMAKAMQRAGEEINRSMR